MPPLRAWTFLIRCRPFPGFGIGRKPQISVVVPCYRQARFLQEAVESVVAQTYCSWEVIIVNDGSPDDTSEVARTLMARHPNRQIRLLEKANGGLADARNAGIRAARGAYILPLDADDRIEPTMLEKTVSLLEANSDLAIAYTDLEHFGQVSKVVQAAEFDPVRICANNQLNYCSLYRREVWEATGGYNSNMVWGYEDWDFWVNSAKRGFRAERIPEPLLSYRVKRASMYTQALQHDQQMRARIVLNHPEHYDAESLARATAVLAKGHLPLPAEEPKVSVIVPTYNRPEMLAQAIQSVLNQTWRDVEIIVVNDAGRDVQELVASLNTRGNIRHIKHATNMGLAAARNSGLKAAGGKYIAYLDDDDVFYPEHLEILVSFAESNGHKVVYSDACRAVQVQDGGSYRILSRDVPYSNDFDYDKVLVRNLLPVLCVLHERACVKQVGFFDEALTTHEDWDYWIRMSRLFQFVHLKRVTCEFRCREDGSTMTNGGRADFLRTARIICDKHKHYACGKPEVLSGQRAMLEGLQQESESLEERRRKAWEALSPTKKMKRRIKGLLLRNNWIQRLGIHRLGECWGHVGGKTRQLLEASTAIKMDFPPETAAPATCYPPINRNLPPRGD